MRSLFILAVLASPALADDASTFQTALLSDTSSVAELLADHVKVQIGIDDRDCKKLAGSVTREDLAPCLHQLAGPSPLVFTPGPLAATPSFEGIGGLLYALTFKAGKVIAVAPVLTNAADAKLPTVRGASHFDFTPSPKLADAIASAKRDVSSIHKICYDAQGKVTSRRLVTSSKLALFDKEATTYIAGRKSKPPAPLGFAIAACEVITVLPPISQDGVEGGEIGGVEGGVVGGVGGDPNGIYGAPPPPPPPPPPADRPQLVPPTMLEGSRIAGEKAIAPDDATKIDIARGQKTKVVGSFKLCVDVAGAINTVSQLKSTGFAAYDGKIIHTIRTTWKYKPYQLNGRAVPVCTAVTFIYSQDLPAAPPPPKP